MRAFVEGTLFGFGLRGNQKESPPIGGGVPSEHGSNASMASSTYQWENEQREPDTNH